MFIIKAQCGHLVSVDSHLSVVAFCSDCHSKKETKHEILIDRAGFSMFPRICCLSCDETIIKQPYMRMADWLKAVQEFYNKHSDRELEEYLNETQRIVKLLD